VTPATFAPSRIKDPALRPLIKKLTVVECAQDYLKTARRSVSKCRPACLPTPTR